MKLAVAQFGSASNVLSTSGSHDFQTERKSPMSKRSNPVLSTWTSVAASLLLVLTLAACAASRQPRGTPEESGFLGNYTELKPGKSGEAALVYINPNTNWKSYTGLIFESVTLWPGKDGGLAKLSPEDQQMLADLLYKNVYDAAAKQIQIVTIPGPGVMRLRVALTEAKSTMVVLNAVATIVPQIRLVTSLGGLAANTSLTVGSATIEGDVRDSLSQERLAAFVDQRIGQRSLRGLGTWSQVDAAFAHWGEQFANRLAELQGRKPAD
jgi:hypothetical protein